MTELTTKIPPDVAAQIRDLSEHAFKQAMHTACLADVGSQPAILQSVGLSLFNQAARIVLTIRTREIGCYDDAASPHVLAIMAVYAEALQAFPDIAAMSKITADGLQRVLPLEPAGSVQ